VSEPEFEFLAVQATLIEENPETGRLEGHALSAPCCDFCSDRRVRWLYPCRTFEIKDLSWGSGDEWIACDRCSALIEAKEPRLLLERSFAGWIAQGRPLLGAITASIGMIQQGFWDHYDDAGRVPFG
jgi:hypothetical protein